MSDGDLRVWVLPSGGQELQLFIHVANGGGHPVTIIPEQIRGDAITTQKDKEKRVRLRAYTPSQYENLIRRRQFVSGNLEAESVSMGNPSRGDPARQPYRAKEDYCSSGHANSSECAAFMITSPVWRTKSLGPSPNDPVLSSELLRKSVVPAYGSRGGMVYMKLVPADAYHITVPIAGKSFAFDFQLHNDDTGGMNSSSPPD